MGYPPQGIQALVLLSSVPDETDGNTVPERFPRRADIYLTIQMASQNGWLKPVEIEKGWAYRGFLSNERCLRVP